MLKFETKTPAQQLVEVMTRIYNLQLTTPSGGNLSVIGENENLWVTPSQIDKGTLTTDDMVLIQTDGNVKGVHKPTMEYLFHKSIYAVRPDIKAVSHAHPSGLVTYSMMQEIAGFNHIPVLTQNVLPIGFATYAIPGSQKLGENIQDAFLNGENAVFMENHGIITTGSNLLDSFHRLENLELMANIYINALQLGDLLTVPENFEKLLHSHVNQDIQYLKENEIEVNEAQIRKELISIIKRSYNRKLINSSTACFSARIADNSFIISPADIDVNYMEAEDLVKVNNGMIENSKTPSNYWKIHEKIYQKHQHFNSISCSQPANIMAFAITNKQFETRTIPESYLFLNEIPKISFNQFYEDIEAVAKIISTKILNIIVENDCFLVAGISPFQVFDRLEVAEFTARSLIHSGLVGKIRMIQKEDIEELEKKFC